MKTYRDFFTDVLHALGIPPFRHTLYAFASVATLEGLNDRYNPLNSVVPHGDSTAFNSVGVQDYKTYENGVAGTVELLRGSPWVNVVHAMRTDQWTRNILHQFSAVYATWGAYPEWPANHALLDENIAGGHETIRKHAPEPSTVHHAPPPEHVTHDNVYVVQSGDSLYNIAAHTLGRAGRWQEIARLNRIVPPYTIYPGQRLTIPTE